MQIRTWAWRPANGCYVGVVKPLHLALSFCFVYGMGQLRGGMCSVLGPTCPAGTPALPFSCCLAWASYLPSVPRFFFFFFHLQHEIGRSPYTSVQHLESYRAMLIHMEQAWGTGHLGSLVSREMPILGGNSPAGNLAPL